MQYRAVANGEVRELAPSEAAALVPHVYEPIEESRADPEPARTPAPRKKAPR